MLTKSIRLAALLPFFQSDSPAGGGGQGDPPTPPTPPVDPSLGEAGKKALDQERAARHLAEKTARDTTKELADLKAARAQEDEAKAKEQGKWQELAEKRDADLQTATKTLESATTELETLRTYVSGDVEAITKSVKDAKDSPAAKALLDFYPGDDASALELLVWAQKAKPRLSELDTTTTTTRGNGPNPRPAGNHKIDEREEINRIRARIPQF